MKLLELKQKIDSYFERVHPLDIVSQFEALGYVFEDIEDDYIIQVSRNTVNKNFVEKSKIGFDFVEVRIDKQVFILESVQPLRFDSYAEEISLSPLSSRYFQAA